jgi:hypothetical protein
MYKIAFSYNGLCEIINIESDPKFLKEHVVKAIQESGFDLDPDAQIDVFANKDFKWLKLNDDGSFSTRELSAADYTFQEQSDEEMIELPFDVDPDVI